MRTGSMQPCEAFLIKKVRCVRAVRSTIKSGGLLIVERVFDAYANDAGFATASDCARNPRAQGAKWSSKQIFINCKTSINS